MRWATFFSSACAIGMGLDVGVVGTQGLAPDPLRPLQRTERAVQDAAFRPPVHPHVGPYGRSRIGPAEHAICSHARPPGEWHGTPADSTGGLWSRYLDSSGVMRLYGTGVSSMNRFRRAVAAENQHRAYPIQVRLYEQALEYEKAENHVFRETWRDCTP